MAERHLRLPQIWPAEQSRAWLGLLSSFAFTFGFFNKESLAFKRLISFVQDLHFSQRFAVFFSAKSRDLRKHMIRLIFDVGQICPFNR